VTARDTTATAIAGLVATTPDSARTSATSRAPAPAGNMKAISPIAQARA